MDTQKSIIEEIQKNDLFPSKIPFERTGILDTSKIMSYEPDFDISQQFAVNLNPDDQLTLITFPTNLAPDAAAAFLIMINASVYIPEKTHTTGVKHFIANHKVVTDFIEKYDSIPDLHKHPVVGPVYQAFIKANKQIDLDSIPEKKAYMFLKYYQPLSFDNNGLVFNDTVGLREKINFMYYLCSDDIDVSTLSPEKLHTKEIYKQFIFQYISALQKAKTKEEQDQIFDKFKHNLVMNGHIFESKINQFGGSFGQIKLSKPLSMQIILDDGSRADLFKLDNSKNYNVMCSVFMSKINQIHDFSNLRINGDFICNKASAPVVLPKFINGYLDLSEYPFISTIIHIPDGVTAVDLSHTIKSFADLNKLKFPKTTNQIRVARSLINNATKNPTELKQIQIFADQYPDIEIWDTKHGKSLREELEKQQQILEKKNQPTKPVESAPVKKQEIAEKTDDWFTRKQIIDILIKDERFVGISDFDRLIKRALKNNSIRTENKLVAGSVQPVLCVYTDDIEIVVNSVLQIINEDQIRADKKEQNKKTNAVKIEKTDKSKTQKKKQTKTLTIEKYIPRNVWKDICDSCNNSNQILYSVLDTVNHINVNYATQTQQNSVRYVDNDGNMQSLSKIRTKGGKAVAQALENKDNRRIVWTINPNDKIMVAIAFFKYHDKGNLANDYNSIALPNAAKGYMMDGKTVVDKKTIQNGDFLKVSELLKQFESQQKNITEQKTEENRDNTAPAVLTPKRTEQEKNIETTDIVKTDLKLPKIDLSTIGTTNNTAIQKRKRYTVRNLVDVKAIEAEITAEIALLDKEIKHLSIEMGKQKNDPTEQLKIANLITKKIQQKIHLMGR